MVDFIEREAVRRVLLNPATRGIDFTEYDLDRIPVADVAPVRHASWLLDGRCSCCLANPLTTHKAYCPNCGAKMDIDR